jgi:hypothetical protein
MARKQLIALVTLLVLTLLPAGGALAQSAARCFPQTGFCISGPIRTYWERNGGLAVFGYPIAPLQSEQVEDWVGPVQWFERDRLEDHSAEGYGVLAGRLGAEVLERQGRPWVYGNEVPGRAGGPCRFFAETGYNVCNLEFRRYWEGNGGLARFGYPITPLIQETIEGRTYQVQYFERRRMEYHPENAAPYNVLLGLLGRDVYAGGPQSRPCAFPVLNELQANYADFSTDRPLGCPVAGEDYSFVQGAAARFERGAMYWINMRGGRSQVLVLIYERNGSVSYRLLEDTWRAGDPVNTGLTPPSGLYEPNRGFGKVWREYPEIRSAIGWALENERPATISFQTFERGALLRAMEDNLVWQLDGRSSARSQVIKY